MNILLRMGEYLSTKNLVKYKLGDFKNIDCQIFQHQRFEKDVDQAWDIFAFYGDDEIPVDGIGDFPFHIENAVF